jgi:hypothetical protein
VASNNVGCPACGLDILIGRQYDQAFDGSNIAAEGAA